MDEESMKQRQGIGNLDDSEAERAGSSNKMTPAPTTNFLIPPFYQMRLNKDLGSVR